MVGAIHLSLDREARRRLETGLLLVSFALLLFALRLVGHFRPDLVPVAYQHVFGIVAALLLLAGTYGLIGSGRGLRQQEGA